MWHYDYARQLFWREILPSDYNSAIQGRGQMDAWEAFCKRERENIVFLRRRTLDYSTLSREEKRREGRCCSPNSGMCNPTGYRHHIVRYGIKTVKKILERKRETSSSGICTMETFKRRHKKNVLDTFHQFIFWGKDLLYRTYLHI